MSSHWISDLPRVLEIVRHPVRALTGVGTPPADISGEDAGLLWRTLLDGTDDIRDAAIKLAGTDTNSVSDIAQWIGRVEAARREVSTTDTRVDGITMPGILTLRVSRSRAGVGLPGFFVLRTGRCR